jgi:hypothetical protein
MTEHTDSIVLHNMTERILCHSVELVCCIMWKARFVIFTKYYLLDQDIEHRVSCIELVNTVC